MNDIAIKIGGNEQLNKIIQELLFENGWGWGWVRDGKKLIPFSEMDNYNPKKICISAESNSSHLGYSEEDFYIEECYKIFDARTQFGEILDWIASQKSIRIQTEGGYIVVYKNGEVEVAEGNLNKVRISLEEFKQVEAAFKKLNS